MERRQMIAALGASLSLSGCLRLSGDSSTPTRSTTGSRTRNTPTATRTTNSPRTASWTDSPTDSPTERPTDSPTESPSPTQSADFPLGLSADGVSPLLADNHVTSLSRQSFSLQYTSASLDGSRTRRDKTVRHEAGRALVDRLVWNPRKYVEVGPGRWNWRSRLSGTQIYGDVTKHFTTVGQLVSVDDLRAQFAGGDFDAPQRESSGAVTEFTVTAQDVSNSDPIEERFDADRVGSFEATARVRESGTIVSFSSTIKLVSDGRLDAFEQQYEVNDLGSVSVSQPNWVSTARSRAPELDDSLVDDSRMLALEHLGGHTVPQQTELKLSERGTQDQQRLPRSLKSGETLYAALGREGTLSMEVGSRPSASDPVLLSEGYSRMMLNNKGWFYQQNIAEL